MHQRVADVAAAEQGQRPGRGEALPQGWHIGTAHTLETQMHHAAAALAQARAQRITHDGLAVACPQPRARLRNRLELQMAAADGADHDLSAKTAIQVPVSRGDRPCVASTVTSTAGSLTSRA